MLKNATTYLTNLTLIKRVVSWAKIKTFPGFQGVSLYEVIRFLYDEVIMNSSTTMRANSIAYSFFMSLFPALLVLFSLIPFIITLLPVKLSDITDQIQFTLNEIMPNKTGEDFTKFVTSFLKKKRSDYFSVGFILSIYFASNGLMALMRGFEKNHAVFIRLTYWQKILRAVGMTFMLGVLLVISTVLVILGNQIFSWFFKLLKISKVAVVFILVLKWLIVIGSIYLGIAVIYRYGVATRRRLHFFSPGAMTATILSLLSSIAFSFYVDHFGKYDKVYGSFVAGIVLLLWLQLNAIILIFGFELNAAIAVNKDSMMTIKDITDDIEEDKEDFENVF